MGNRTRCSYLLKANPSGPRDCSRAMARQPVGKRRRNWATHSWMASGVCSSSPCSTLLEPSTCRAQACFLSPQSIPMKAATSAGKRLLYRTYLSFMAYGLPVYGQDLVPCVVGRHVGAGAALHECHAERHRVILAQQANIEVGGGAVAAVLIAVGEEVLDQRSGLPVLGIAALNSLDQGRRQGAVEHRILTIAFLRAAPARVSRQVGVGRQQHQERLGVLTVLKDVSRLRPDDVSGDRK